MNMNKLQHLQGKTIVITGATSGIGQAAAEELGWRGAEVIVHGRDIARGAAVASEHADIANARIRFENGAVATITKPTSNEKLLETVARVLADADAARLAGTYTASNTTLNNNAGTIRIVAGSKRLTW